MNPWSEVADIFLPFAVGEEAALAEAGQRFAHYTSAATAMSILKGKEIWMRKPYVMNDASEIEHGARILAMIWRTELGARYRQAMEAAKPGLIQKIIPNFERWLDQSKHNTYLACVSKHHASEDDTGRLSMWRAYGGNRGVALIFKGDAFVRDGGELNVFSSPVAYVSKIDMEREFERVVANIESRVDFLRNADDGAVHELAFRMWVFAAVAAKNPGFKEEEEWRLIYAPDLWHSKHLRSSIQLIGDQPQKIFKLPLDGGGDPNLEWLSPDALIDRVLIGPGPDRDVIGEAMFELLSEAGVRNAERKIVYSSIPLRR